MSVIVITQEVVEQVKAAKKHALENRYTIPMLEEIRDGKRPPPGDDPKHVVNLPGTGCRVVVSLDEMLSRDGWMWHVSASIPKPRFMPSPIIIDQLLKMGGFDGADEIGAIWLEPLNPDEGTERSAINICVKAKGVGP